MDEVGPYSYVEYGYERVHAWIIETVVGVYFIVGTV